MNKPTPFGKTYKEYTEAIEKFELSKTEKVELGLVDDLGKLNKQLQNFISKNSKVAKQFVDLKKEMKSLEGDSEKLIKKFRPVKTEIFNQAKALGLKPADIPQYKTAQGVDGDMMDLFNLISNSLR